MVKPTVWLDTTWDCIAVKHVVRRVEDLLAGKTIGVLPKSPKGWLSKERGMKRRMEEAWNFVEGRYIW